MKTIFFLIRLLFYPLLLTMLIGIGVFLFLIQCLALIWLPFHITFLLIYIFLTGIGVFIDAAFSNNQRKLDHFNRKVQNDLSEAFKQDLFLMPFIPSFLESFTGLHRWLLTGNPDS